MLMEYAFVVKILIFSDFYLVKSNCLAEVGVLCSKLKRSRGSQSSVWPRGYQENSFTFILYQSTWVPVLAPSQHQLPANAGHGRQQSMGQLHGCLSPTWDTWVESEKPSLCKWLLVSAIAGIWGINQYMTLPSLPYPFFFPLHPFYINGI